MKPIKIENLMENSFQKELSRQQRSLDEKKKMKIGNLNITEIENIYFFPDNGNDTEENNEFRLEPVQEEIIKLDKKQSIAEKPLQELESMPKEKPVRFRQIEDKAQKKVQGVLNQLSLPRVENPQLNKTETIETAQIIEDKEEKAEKKEDSIEFKISDTEPAKTDKSQIHTEEKTEEQEISPAVKEKEKQKKPAIKSEGKEEFIPAFTDTKYTIKFKLIAITSLIIASSLTAMILLATNFFKKDNKIRIDESNLKLAEVIAGKMKTDFLSLVEKARMMAVISSEQNRTQRQKKSLIDLYFANNKEMIFLGITGIRGNSLYYSKELISEKFLETNSFTEKELSNLHKLNLPYFKNTLSGQIIIRNLSQGSTIPILAMGIPFRRYGSKFSSSIIMYMKLENMLKTFRTSGIIQAFMTNAEGDVIAHPDSRVVFSNANWVDLPIVNRMITSKMDNGKTRYKDQNQIVYLGAFKKLGFGGLGVLTNVQEEIAFEAVYAIQRRNFYILVIGLNIAILIIYFFAKSLTNPIIRLVGATRKIEEGIYQLNIKPTTQDEIGALTSSFIAMGKGLEEREKMKDAFGKFVNKEIAEQAMKGEIQLGGEKKTCAIFFSDIRGFTAISEKLEPEEVVEFLNEYMTAMVKCINDTNGVVDKYIGDAIMAHWGAIVSKGNDTENAVNAALMMREALLRFNIGRGGDKKPIIKFGAGINTGDVISGQIGSDERLEFTVIGDAVNLASRVEALNKPFGTDLLVTQDSRDLVNDIFNFEAMPAIKVKGKSKPQTIFAVLGRKNDPNCPKSMDEVRKIAGIDFDSSKKISSEDKEVKYEILE